MDKTKLHISQAEQLKKISKSQKEIHFGVDSTPPLDSSMSSSHLKHITSPSLANVRQISQFGETENKLDSTENKNDITNNNRKMGWAYYNNEIRISDA